MSGSKPDFSYFFRSPKMVNVNFDYFTKGDPVIVPGEASTPSDKPFSYRLYHYLGIDNYETRNEASYSTESTERTLELHEAEAPFTIVDGSEIFENISSSAIAAVTDTSVPSVVTEKLQETLTQGKNDANISKKHSNSELITALDDFVDNYIFEYKDNEMFTREAYELFCEKYFSFEYSVFGKKLKAALDKKFGKDHICGKKKANLKYGTNPQKFYEGLKLKQE